MSDAILDRLREVVIFVAGIIAIGSLILAIYEGFNQRISGAIFLGTLGIVCTFMLFMPRLEVFKVWGIEARLTRLDKTLDRAEEVLGRIRKLASITACASYLTIAWSNRLGTPKAEDKQIVLNDIDAQLTDLKVTTEERATIIQPWVRMIRADFFFLFTRVVREFATLKASDLTRKIQETNSHEANDASLVHSNLITPWSKRTNDFGALERLDVKRLSDVMDEYMPEKGGWLSEKELATIEVFKKEIVRLMPIARKKGATQ